MPTNLFFQLDEEKRAKILKVGIEEFASHGYENSSTNSIVKKAGISKGSLFKYFQGKEELYFYLLDCVTAELRSSVEEHIDKLPKDIFQRIIRYSELEFTWYILNPEKCQLIVKGFAKSDTEIYKKTAERYNNEGSDIFYELIADIDAEQFSGDKGTIINMVKWILQGFNAEFIDRVKLENSNHIERIRNEYVNSLTEYLRLLKGGIIV